MTPESRLPPVLLQFPGAVFRLDPTGRVAEANLAAAARLRCSPVGAPFLEFLEPASRAKALEMLGTPSSVPVELTIATPSG